MRSMSKHTTLGVFLDVCVSRSIPFVLTDSDFSECLNCNDSIQIVAITSRETF